MRNKHRDSGRSHPAELRKGYRTPEGLRGWMLEEYDVMIEDGDGLADSAVIKAFEKSNVANTYQFSGEINVVGEDLEFRGDFSAYLRTDGGPLRNEFNESPRWGDADTYGHTRRIPKKGKYNGQGERNESVRTFQRCNRYNQRRVNFDVGEAMEDDNGNYYDGDWGNSAYLGDHLSQVNFAENGKDYTPQSR